MDVAAFDKRGKKAKCKGKYGKIEGKAPGGSGAGKALMVTAIFVTSTDTRPQTVGHSKDHLKETDIRQKTEEEAKLKMEESQTVVQGRKAKAIKANMCRHSKQMAQKEPKGQTENLGMKEFGGKK